ncbi:MAG: prepilin-type N-terminal cleavage/methylation domain-containing protein [Planctomycetes bacterium]|nr:prepilin-type N-terminal cleavage/methylation domain-containing protein [Planctomycetota bacterium]
MNKDKKAFTLVELLVVISIIALLMAIMMPALNVVKDRAKALVCKSNLKQMGLGVEMYLTNNDDKLPELNTGISWLYVFRPYFENQQYDKKYFDPSKKPNFRSVRFCPNGTLPPGTSASNSYWIAGAYGDVDAPTSSSYSINTWILYWSTWPNATQEKSWGGHRPGKDSDKIPIFADGSWRDSHGDQTVPLNNLEGAYGGAGSNSSLQTHALIRHRNGVNVLFMDGSVNHCPIRDMYNLKWNKFFDTTKVFQDSWWPEWVPQ